MDFQEVSFLDFPNICRICLSKKAPVKSFVHLFDVFRILTNIEVTSEDNLPKNLCMKCLNNLGEISSFIDLSRNSDTYLKKIFDEHENSLFRNTGSESDGFDCSVEIGYNPESEDVNNINEYTITEENNKTVILNENGKGKEKNVIRHSTKRQHSTCSICGEHFSSKSRLVEHQKKNINCKNKPYKCTKCEKAFFTKFKLKVHMRSHTKEMPFECKICFKKFRFAANIKRHDNIVHKGLKPFKCETCGKEFARLERKIQHVNIHTGKDPHICHCGDSFRHKSTYLDHIMQHRIKNGELQSLSDNQCHICKKIFVSKYRLHSHVQIHSGEKEFLCSTCGKCFLKKHNLDVHFRAHTEEKPFECKQCNKQFKYASGYKAHVLTHTEERSYKCSICSKKFKQSAHLQSHIKVHTGEKPFKCMFCGKSFTHNSNRKVHMRIHLSEMPYHCTICNKAFYDSSSMKKHEKRHDKVKNN